MADTENSGDRAMARPGHEHVAAVRTRLAEQRWDWIAWWRAEEREQMDGEVRQALNATPASVIADVLEAAAELGLLATARIRPPADKTSELEKLAAHIEAVAEIHAIGGKDWQRGMGDAARLLRRADNRTETTMLITTADPMATHSPDDGHPQNALLPEAMRAAWSAGVDAAIHETRRAANTYVDGGARHEALSKLYDQLAAVSGQSDLLDPDLITLYQSRATTEETPEAER